MNIHTNILNEVLGKWIQATGSVSQSVQSLSRVQFFETPWIAARQASMSITNSRRLPKPMSIESVNASLPCFARGSLFLIGACLWWLFTSLIWQSRLVLSKLVCCPLCSLWPGQWKGPHNRCSPGLPSSFQTEKSELVVAFRAACVSPRWRRTEGHVLLCAGVTAGDGSGGRPCFLPDLQLAVQSGEPSLCMFCQDNIQCSKWSN